MEGSGMCVLSEIKERREREREEKLLTDDHLPICGPGEPDKPGSHPGSDNNAW